MWYCVPNRSYIKEGHFDFGTFVDKLLKDRPLAPRANGMDDVSSIKLCTLTTQ